MAQARPEIPPDAWRELFDQLTEGFGDHDVTIEVISEELGDEYEAERLPLAFLMYDPKDDAFIVGVGGRDRRYPVLRHIIQRPQRILADKVSDDVPWAIDVFGTDGAQTIVTIHRAGAPSPASG